MFDEMCEHEESQSNRLKHLEFYWTLIKCLQSVLTKFSFDKVTIIIVIETVNKTITVCKVSNGIIYILSMLHMFENTNLLSDKAQM